MSEDRTIEQFLRDMRDTADGVALLVADTDRETFMTSPTGSWAIERGIIQLGEIASQLRNRHADYVEAHPELDPPGMRSGHRSVVRQERGLDDCRRCASDTPGPHAGSSSPKRALRKGGWKRMSEYRSKLRRSRLVPLVAVAILGLALVSACGSTKKAEGGTKKVEFSISSAGLSQVENAAPSKDYVLYVAGASVPSSAADFGNYSVVQCITGETAVNRAMAVSQGIQIGIGGSHSISIAAGDGTADGIKKALAGEVTSGGKCLVLVKRESPVPSDAVEVVLK